MMNSIFQENKNFGLLEFFCYIISNMGFKISPFEAFDRAERIHDKVNRKIKTSAHKEPTLEEQLQSLELLEEKKRVERQKQREQENQSRFTPAAAARVAYENALKQEQEKQAKLAERKKK